MKLKDYIADLKKLMNDNPGSADLLVVYSSDDEGNNFGPVVYSVAIGEYADGSFTADSSTKNAVCIN